MSKYDPLWRRLGQTDADSLLLTFDEIGEISGAALDHSFLKYKKRSGRLRLGCRQDFAQGKNVVFRRLKNETP